MAGYDEIETKIGQLLDEHFPWGEQEHPPKPSTEEERRAYVLQWLKGETQIFDAAATALVARIVPVLKFAQEELLDYERERFFFRIDSSHMAKSPEGVLEKMAREWRQEQGIPPISFHNLHELTDLGRFRVVVNFLQDLEVIKKKLEAPYHARRDLRKEQSALFDEFHLRSNQFRNLIDLLPAERKKGERCLKGVFQLKADANILIEVQLMTSLQEGWDKKDHFLLYEQRRRGLTWPCPFQQ